MYVTCAVAWRGRTACASRRSSAVWYHVLQCAAVCCSVLQSVAVCCSVLQSSAVLQCDTMCCSVLLCVAVRCSPRVEWRGLTACAMRTKACVFRKLIQITLSWNFLFLQNILKLRLSPEIPTQIDWHLKIQNTTFVCIKFPPPIVSPLYSTRGYVHCMYICTLQLYI